MASAVEGGEGVVAGQEACNLSVELGSLPVFAVVFERSQELDETFLGGRPIFVSLHHEHKQVLVECHVAAVDCAVDLGGVQDSVVVDFPN